MGRYLYIETDGMLYLVKKGERWTLPGEAERAEIPFEFERKAVLRVRGHEVVYCVPKLAHHPRDWHPKDEIPGRDDVEAWVRLAVHHTLPRVVVEALIVQDDRVLLVKPSRGFNRGTWTLPGGFVSYGESLPEAVRREVEEEVGAPCRVGKLLGVYSFLGKESHYTWHMFTYEVEVLAEEFRPAADEIEEVRWVPLPEALRRVHGIKQKILRDYLETRS
jgi:ADP-ribose pyrophosphatase YjhB (NUDIX family)